jgi:branched-chain amino acid transport system permease protein
MPQGLCWRRHDPHCRCAVRILSVCSTWQGDRACADNYTGALVVGLDVKRLYALSFGLGAACVGAAGAIIVLIVDVTPPLGPAYTLLAFVIVITGGLGSMPGALLGGILIGMTEAMAGLFFTPSAKSMFAFGLLVLVPLFRPQGILGKSPS